MSVSSNQDVLARLGRGDFFGEIGILNLGGLASSASGLGLLANQASRRTADVRSVGYSELFVLSREDVLDALRDHPDAEVCSDFAR